MRVLYISGYHNQKETTMPFVLDQMKAAARCGHEVIALIPIPFGKKDILGRRFSLKAHDENYDGIRFVFFRYISFSKYGIWRANINNAKISLLFLKKKLKEIDPDVIHAHTIGFYSEIGYRIKKWVECPVVVTIHGSDLETPRELNKVEKIKEWSDHIDAIITVSEKLKRELLDIHVKTLSRVITNGFNARDCGPCKKKPYSIIQVGSLIESKHYETTIEAFAKYKKKHVDASLTIIGEGPMKESLLQLCRNMGISDNVLFIDHLANKEVMEKMSEASYFIMPSFPEGLGIVYLEAMYVKCITIGTIGEGIDGIIIDRENGFLVSKGDSESICEKLNYCDDNPERAMVIAENAYNTVKGFTWENNVSKCVSLYGEMISV